MITRVWEGTVRIELSNEYVKIIEKRDIPNYKNTPGFLKLKFLKRSDEKFTYFKLLTFWNEMGSILKITGPNFQKAVSFKEDQEYLVDFPGKVLHYEVFAEI